MTRDDFDKLTDEQREAMRAHVQRTGSSLDDLIRRANPPTPLCPYVGFEWCGMFVGIEPDGCTACICSLR